MKRCFLRAAAHVQGKTGAGLQEAVQQADEMLALWRLGPSLLSAMPRGEAEADIHRHDVLQQLERALPVRRSTAGWARG